MGPESFSRLPGPGQDVLQGWAYKAICAPLAFDRHEKIHESYDPIPAPNRRTNGQLHGRNLSRQGDSVPRQGYPPHFLDF